MKKFTFLAIASLLAISLTAQLTWNINNPKLGFNEIFDVFFADENNGWAISNVVSNNIYSGIVHHSSNGGGQWDEQFHLENDGGIYGLFFVNNQKGWIVGASGVLLKTTNGGKNWAKSNLPVNAVLFNVFFKDENTGWVVGDFEGIFYTTDGGNYWDFADQGTYDAHTDIYFFNNQVGIAIGVNEDGDKSRILKSTDGGLTWSLKYLFNNDVLTSVFFVDENNGWAVGDGGNIIHSSDGGETWFVQESNVDWRLDKVRFVNQNKGSVCGAEGIIFTSDGGNTWTETSITNVWLSGLCFVNQNKGYAVGYYNTGWEQMSAYYTSVDGGETWENRNAHAAYLSVICAINENTILAGGGDYHTNENPCVMKTINNGNSWDYKEFTNWYSPIEDICFASGKVYAVNNSGYILKSNDLGDNWDMIEQVIGLKNYTNVSLFFCDENMGWIAGESTVGSGRGTIYHTTQGGIGWTKQIDGEFNTVYGIQFIGQNKGWAITARDYEGGNWIPGQILFTENGGSNWYQQNTTGDFNYTGLCFMNDQVGWVCGDVILKTTNGGNTWTIQLDPDKVINSISFIDENNGYAVGDGGVIYRTSNGGQEWVLENKLTNEDLKDVCFASSNQAWAVGYKGLILHAAVQSSSYVESNSGYNLAKIFPNPGCGKFNVEPTYLHSGIILITITDIKGRIILERKINSGQVQPTIIDISDQPEGLYILKLISKSFQESSKLIKH